MYSPPCAELISVPVPVRYLKAIRTTSHHAFFRCWGSFMCCNHVPFPANQRLSRSEAGCREIHSTVLPFIYMHMSVHTDIPISSSIVLESSSPLLSDPDCSVSFLSSSTPMNMVHGKLDRIHRELLVSYPVKHPIPIILQRESKVRPRGWEYPVLEKDTDADRLPSRCSERAAYLKHRPPRDFLSSSGQEHL